ncbi:hypothetical protein [Ornithinimicrobium cryptoxanthini]|uniref:hypothetical protein n=1 Tax=Ornithinimicrobium cryptoxanthini TaxID=2934161 RepID=UPI0021187848|nr:hypothetical protein [Ornithinimicrobium cryptoxanthini]
MTAEPNVNTTGAPPSSLFLVELRAAIGVSTDLSRMHRDLTTTIARLGERGVDIRAGAYFLPEDDRCLCLVRGADKGTIGLACDTAGLSAAPVYEAHRISGRPSRLNPSEECTCHR